MSQYYYKLVKIAQLLSRRPIKKISNYYVEWCLLDWWRDAYLMNHHKIESFLHNVLQSVVKEDDWWKIVEKRMIINQR